MTEAAVHEPVPVNVHTLEAAKAGGGRRKPQVSKRKAAAMQHDDAEVNDANTEDTDQTDQTPKTKKPKTKKTTVKKDALESPTEPEGLEEVEKTENATAEPEGPNEPDEEAMETVKNSIAIALKTVPRREKTSKSRVMSAAIPALTVGEVRKCLNQIRRAGAQVSENHLLANGMPAGRFALMYLLGNYANKINKNRSGTSDEESRCSETGSVTAAEGA